MARIFCPKKIYRVSNSSQFPPNILKSMSSMIKMMIHVESAVSKKKPPTTSYQVAMVFHQQNTLNAMITSVNAFMFSYY